MADDSRNAGKLPTFTEPTRSLVDTSERRLVPPYTSKCRPLMVVWMLDVCLAATSILLSVLRVKHP